MSIKLDVLILNKVFLILANIFLCLLPHLGFAKAWPLAVKKLYSTQKLILKPSYLFNTEIIYGNESKTLEIKTREKLVEQYVEYGLTPDITVMMKLDQVMISEEIVTYNIGLGLKPKFNHNKLHVSIGILKNLLRNNIVFSLYSMLHSGSYIIDNLGSRYLPRKASVSLGGAMGRSFYLYKNCIESFYEIDIEGFPCLRNSALIVKSMITAGLKYKKFTYTISGYNLNNYQDCSYNSTIRNLQNINMKYIDYRIKENPVRRYKYNVSKLQFGISYLLYANNSIQFDIACSSKYSKKNRYLNLMIAYNREI